ncbi:MAG TPA: F0F1 ATP synthase subunit delta [Acidothermaceae bacterium]
MQGASRDALAHAWSFVERQLPAREGSDDHEAATVGEELFGVVAVLDDQVGLRRALSDPSVDAKRKAALATAVLGSHVSDVTLRIVTEVVRARWSRMRDLADALETVAVLAMLIEADAHPGRGHHAGESDDVEDELFRFGRIVEANADLRSALADPALPDENKVSLVNALVEDKARPVTVRLLTQVATRPRGRSPEDAIADYTDIASQRRTRLVARVTTAVALSDSEITRLQEALAGLYGHQVHLQIEVDADIVGGVVVHVGDEVLDGSVAGRLAEARRRLE